MTPVPATTTGGVATAPVPDPVNTPYTLSVQDIQALQSTLRELQSQVSALSQQQAAALTAATTPAPIAGSSSRVVLNLYVPDNLAGEAYLHLDNPIPCPASLSDDREAVPCFFDPSAPTGASKVNANLGTAAGYEVETLDCAISFYQTGARVSTERAHAAIKLLQPRGQSDTVTPAHLRPESIRHLVDYNQHIRGLLSQRFCLLAAAATAPYKTTLLSVLTTNVVRNSTVEVLIPDPGVLIVLQDPEPKRATANFNKAANHEANQGQDRGPRSNQDHHLGHRSPAGGRTRGNRGGRDWGERNNDPSNGGASSSTQ